MDDDRLFRLVLLAWLALTLPAALVYRLRSQSSGERLDRRQEGLFTLVALRLAGLALAIVLTAWFIDPALLALSAWPAPLWLRWAGAALLPAASSLLLWAFHHLGRNLTDTVVTRKEHALVVSGPYRWVRHPFYVAGLLGLVALSLVTANWLMPLIGAAAAVLIVRRTRTEEDKLIERFGDEYRAYMRRTGRFFPRRGGSGGAEGHHER